MHEHLFALDIAHGQVAQVERQGHTAAGIVGKRDTVEPELACQGR